MDGVSRIGRCMYTSKRSDMSIAVTKILVNYARDSCGRCCDKMYVGTQLLVFQWRSLREDIFSKAVSEQNRFVKTELF